MVGARRTKKGASWSGLLIAMVVISGLGKGTGQTCTTYASDLYTCFPYIEEGNSTKLGADCCKRLQKVVSTRPDCVCTLQNLTAIVPKVNLTRAYQLNSLCNITSTATLSSCNGTSAPAPAPAATDKNGAYPLQKSCILQVIVLGVALVFGIVS